MGDSAYRRYLEQSDSETGSGTGAAEGAGQSFSGCRVSVLLEMDGGDYVNVRNTI